MAYIQQEQESTSPKRIKSLAERVQQLEKQRTLAQRSEETMRETKPFRWSFKWRTKFKQTKRKINEEKMLVIFLNKKNEIETPRFMPIFDGNMIVWKNKPYEFDPRATWIVKGFKGNPRAYLIKEIDRRPVMNKYGKVVYRDAAVSNMDIDEIRARGDSTESDEFLIKAALKAQTNKIGKPINIAILVIIGIIVLGVVGWFLFGK